MSWTSFIRKLIGARSEPIVVSFLSGPEDLALKMLAEVRSLVPQHEHYAVANQTLPPIEGVEILTLGEARSRLRGKRIGLAPVLFTSDPVYAPLRRAAVRLAPHKLLAYNERLERHHLRLSTFIASLLFLKGVPLDRIWLRPRWLMPWAGEKSTPPSTFREHEGRPLDSSRRRIGILSPYFPYPLTHGGAVRIYNLLREASKHFDIFLFTFGEGEIAPVTNLCARVFQVPTPRYREPRWSTLLPPEVHEFDVPLMNRLIAEARSKYEIALLQVEYTQLARYRGDILVEHDVTFDLYRQIHDRERRLASWWNWKRWLRFEQRITRYYQAVVAMSEKDKAQLQLIQAHVIPNGVDLSRFHPEPEQPGARVLFVGSFRHFPNVVAYRFLVDEIWPLIRTAIPDAHLTVVAGPDPGQFCQIQSDASITLHSFVADVRPLYVEANVVMVPTKVSAGTNLKVLEAMAMRRAVVSTSSGCAGLGLQHGRNVMIAEDAAGLADHCVELLRDSRQREHLASAAAVHCHRHFDWRQIGRLQKRLWDKLLGVDPLIRRGTQADLTAVSEIQSHSPGAALWRPPDYLVYDLRVAEIRGEIVAFLVTRSVAGETEILNLAVAPAHRRKRLASLLIEALPPTTLHLEVRESNVAARALYAGCGFTETGRREGYYHDPDEAAILMQKP